LKKIMSSHTAEIATESRLTSNPLDVIPNEIPFDVPYGLSISPDQDRAAIQAAVAEARKRNWKMNGTPAGSRAAQSGPTVSNPSPVPPRDML